MWVISKTTCTLLKFLYLFSFESLSLFDRILYGSRLPFCKMDFQEKQKLDFTAWMTLSHCQAKRV